MRISRAADVPNDTSPDPNFSGLAERKAFGRMESLPGGLTPFLVRFRDGTRTSWHRHAAGQLLYVIEGRGFVAARGEEPVAIAPGDLVETAPGEEHWHGAADDSDLAHLALSFGETTWAEPAT